MYILNTERLIVAFISSLGSKVELYNTSSSYTAETELKLKTRVNPKATFGTSDEIIFCHSTKIL